MSTPIASHVSTVPIANSELHTLTSTYVGQQYFIKVRLPEAYFASTATFPVLYLLDGDHAFAMATDIVQYLIYGQHVPDLIIVSPAYGSKSTPEYGGTNMRNRDLLPFPMEGVDTTPQAAAFLQFFQQELIPFVESTYRVDNADRTLAGYSAGALFVLYTFFQRPILFRRYIAIEGFDQRFVAIEENFSAGTQNLSDKQFVSVGHDNMFEFASRLQTRGYPGLAVEHVHLSPLGHFAVGAEGLTKGLVSAFRA